MEHLGSFAVFRPQFAKTLRFKSTDSKGQYVYGGNFLFASIQIEVLIHRGHFVSIAEWLIPVNSREIQWVAQCYRVNFMIDP